MAISHMASATATAAPEDEPPGMRLRSAGRAVMRVETEAAGGEFGHVGLGDDDATGGAQPAHHRRIGRRGRRGSEHLRPGAGRFAGDIEPVLDGHDRAVQRTEREPGTGAGIGSIGGKPGGVGIHGEAGARALAVGVGNLRERLFEAIPRRTANHHGRRLGRLGGLGRFGRLGVRSVRRARCRQERGGAGNQPPAAERNASGLAHVSPSVIHVQVRFPMSRRRRAGAAFGDAPRPRNTVIALLSRKTSL
jgi:hypothetical protein